MRGIVDMNALANMESVRPFACIMAFTLLLRTIWWKRGRYYLFTKHGATAARCSYPTLYCQISGVLITALKMSPHVVSRRSFSRQVTHSLMHSSRIVLSSPSLTLFPFFLDFVIVCQLVPLKIVTIRPRCPLKVSTI